MKYIFLDVDGTLIQPGEGKIPLSAKEAIKKTRELGNKVFVCTGRAISSIQDLNECDFDGFVCSIGTCISVNGNIIYRLPFPNSEVQHISELLEMFEIGYTIEGEKGNYYSQLGKIEFKKCINEKRYASGYEDFLVQIGFYPLSEKSDDIIYKFAYYTRSDEKHQCLINKLSEKFKVIATFSKENNLYEGEIVQLKCSKLVGIYRVLEYYGATIEDSICVGDGMNDYEMIEGCAIGIAMGNGCQEIKSVANYTTTRVEEDGILNAFKKFELI